MEYNREYWEPRIATKPNRFRKLNESNDYVELINEPEAISQAGTAFTAARMNNIEAGIEGVVAEVNEIQGVLDLTGQVPTFAGNADTADKWKTARNISISDADGTNTGSAVSVDGSENETLKLPATIKANLTGNADTADAIKPLGNSITLPATSATKIIKIATVSWIYSGLIKIVCEGSGINEVIKVYVDGGDARHSGIRVTYGKHAAPYGIKKIIVTLDAEIYSSNRHIYAEIVPYQNFESTATLGVVETNRGTFTPSMTEVSSVEGTVVDSLPLDYLRGDISSYQHEFTKDIIGNLTGNADTATNAANADLLDGLNSSDFPRKYTFTGAESSVDLNTITDVGFYNATDFAYTTTTFLNTPVAVGPGGFTLISTRIGGGYVLQLFQPYSAGSPTLYKRSSYYYSGNIVWGPWVKVWDSGNDGSGSGLDADLWDAIHRPRSFGVSGDGGQSPVTSGDVLTTLTKIGDNGIFSPAVANVPTNTYCSISLILGGDVADRSIFLATVAGNSSNVWIGARSDTAIIWNKLWGDSNDGSGSGLDADLLDGQHGSYYAPLASPTLTGTPKAPTPATETNNTQIATTAFVKNQGYEPNRGTGTNSLALGIGSEASGYRSIALGNSATASGSNSIALGTGATASEEFSTALGWLSEASENYSIALGIEARANGVGATALGTSSEASGYRSIALGNSATASGSDSIALGDNSKASGVGAVALGWASEASGAGSTALGRLSTASGNYSTALGYNVEASRDYQITIVNRFVYLRFASTETEATVYDALSPWLNPTVPSSQGAMGSFGTQEVVRLRRPNSTTIELYDNSNTSIKTISSGNTTQIGSDLAICTVRY